MYFQPQKIMTCTLNFCDFDVSHVYFLMVEKLFRHFFKLKILHFETSNLMKLKNYVMIYELS